MKRFNKKLTEIINRITEVSGKPVVFAAMIVLVAAWFIAGAFFRYDESWFTILDAFVFLVTFFLVFVVQSSQNADTKAMQDKLDEIIENLPGADTSKEREEKKFKRGEEDA